MDKDIETRLRQGPAVAINFPDLTGLLPIKTVLFHLTVHEDSPSEYYGIELSKEQYKLVKKRIVEKYK